MDVKCRWPLKQIYLRVLCRQMTENCCKWTGSSNAMVDFVFLPPISLSPNPFPSWSLPCLLQRLLRWLKNGVSTPKEHVLFHRLEFTAMIEAKAKCTCPSHFSIMFCFVTWSCFFVQVRDHPFSNVVSSFLTAFFTPTCTLAALYIFRFRCWLENKLHNLSSKEKNTKNGIQ